MPLCHNKNMLIPLSWLLIIELGGTTMALCWRITVDNSFPLSLAKIKEPKYFTGNVVIGLWVPSECVSCYMNISSSFRKA